MGMRSPMPPENMAAPPQQSTEGSGKASQLLVEINSKLNQLAGMVEKSPLAEEDKGKLDTAVAAFMDFADSLAQVPGGEKPQPKIQKGYVPPETQGQPAIPAL